jgi:DNA-binding response OmpR family regulator
VEDDRQLSAMLAELLTEEGYEVEVARDGQRGLHLGLAHRHEILIVDRGLPAIEGVDLVRRIRSHATLCDLTSSGRDISQRTCVHIGSLPRPARG